MSDPRDRFEEIMRQIMSEGLDKIEQLTDEELDGVDDDQHREPNPMATKQH